MYRIFGSPYALQTHQFSLFLHHKGLKYDLHISSLWGTKLAAWWHKSQTAVGVLSPHGRSLMGLPDLVAEIELRHPTPSLIPNAKTNPMLRTACMGLYLYGLWWLMNIGGMFRWVHGEGSQMVSAHASYFMVSFVPVSPQFCRQVRLKMKELLATYGITHTSEPYLIAHFYKLCGALEAHFARGHLFLLGGTSPSIADVVFGAAFQCHFLQDDPPHTELRDRFVHLFSWIDRIAITDTTGLGASGDIASPKLSQKRKRPAKRDSSNSTGSTVRVDEDAAAQSLHTVFGQPVAAQFDAATRRSGGGSDHVLPSLAPVLELVVEVFPWLVSQCDAAKMYYAARSTKERPALLEAVGVEGFGVPRVINHAWEMNVGEGASLSCGINVAAVAAAQDIAEDVARYWEVDSEATMVTAAEQARRQKAEEHVRRREATDEGGSVRTAAAAGSDQSQTTTAATALGQERDVMVELHHLLMRMRSKDFHFVQLPESSSDFGFGMVAGKKPLQPTG